MELDLIKSIFLDFDLDLIISIFLLTRQKNTHFRKTNENFFFRFLQKNLHVPDVVEFNKLININQDFSSKICNAIRENHCKSYYGQNTM